MNTERTEKFVNAIACDLEEGGFRQVSGTTLRRTLATAVSAALPLLEAGSPVSELAEQQGVALPPLPRMQEFTSLYGRVSAFGPDQMRDYARAAFAAGATAASTGAVLVNMGDSEAEFIRMGNDESALATTGKQQVGEVQGGARSQFEAWVESRLQYGLHKNPDGTYNWITVQEHWEGWQAALAARQLGAIPAGWRLVPELASEGQLRAALDTGVYHDGEDSARAVLADEYRTMVAAAPPAQSIDLGQLPRYSKSYSEGVCRDNSGDWVKWEDVQALINPRDAAPGPRISQGTHDPSGVGNG